LSSRSSTPEASHFPTPPFLSSPLYFQNPSVPPSGPPSLGFHKVNFDGASKGNLGHSRYGAVIRNRLGKIQSLTAGNLEYDTKNLAEIWALIKWVKMGLDQNLTCLIIEGEPKIIIDLATKILNGRYLGKITLG
jgi:hypothetical protein